MTTDELKALRPERGPIFVVSREDVVEFIALREREARLVEALRGIKADCLERAAFSRDGQTVPIGDGAWRGLCAVLAEIEKEAGG